MPNEVLCQIDLFDQKQHITWPDGHEDNIELKDIPVYLSKMCHKNDVPIIHLFGHEPFLQGLIRQIQGEEIYRYGKIQVKFEVN